MSAEISASSWRRRVALPLALVGMASAWMLVGTSSAVDPPPPFGVQGSSFEILDGDTDIDNPHDLDPTSIDWNRLNTNATPDTYTATIETDPFTGGQDDAFGNGAKEDSAVPGVVSGSIPPNKSDLKSFGSYTERSPAGQYVHLFWTRVQDPSGTTNMDFEFNKKSCVAGGDVSGCSANDVTPERSDGDLLITYDLSRGGSEADINLRRWNGAAGVWGPVQDLSATIATGSINRTDITGSDVPVGDYSARTFGEASIKMSQIFSSTVCEAFGSAYLKSRSSDSFTSALKDFIAPVAASISNCGQLKIVKRDDAGAAMAGVVFTLHEKIVSPAGAVTTGDATDFTCTTSATGTCTFTDSDDGTGIDFGDYMVREAVPTGYAPKADFPVTVSSSSGATPITVVNNRNPASVTFNKTDDVGTPIQNAVFTLLKDVAPTATADGFASGTNIVGAGDVATSSTCTTSSTGVCTIAGILDPGTYWLRETTTPAGHASVADYRITLTLGQVLDLSAVGFVDARQFKVLTLVCVDNTGKNAAVAATPGLYGAKVAYGSDPLPATANTLTSVPSVLADKGVTAADLCNAVGGAVLNPTGTGSKTSAIAIP